MLYELLLNHSILCLCFSLNFTANDAINNTHKTKSCKLTLQHSNFNSIIYNEENGYDEFISERMNILFPPDIILCLANEKNVWSSIQQNYPPLVLHATTTKNWGTNFGSHSPISEWCIMCRFHDEIKSESALVCSESIIKVNEEGEEILGVLPFLSPTSAAMVLAELGRLTVNTNKFNKNSINLSFRTTPLNYIIKTQKSPNKNCPICPNQDPNIYPLERTKSKYWKY